MVREEGGTAGDAPEPPPLQGAGRAMLWVGGGRPSSEGACGQQRKGVCKTWFVPSEPHPWGGPWMLQVAGNREAINSKKRTHDQGRLPVAQAAAHTAPPWDHSLWPAGPLSMLGFCPANPSSPGKLSTLCDADGVDLGPGLSQPCSVYPPPNVPWARSRVRAAQSQRTLQGCAGKGLLLRSQAPCAGAAASARPVFRQFRPICSTAPTVLPRLLAC